MAKRARQKPKKSVSAEPSYEAKFVAALVSDPVHPPKLHLFRGYLGKSAVTGHRRLYLSANLAKYIDLPESGIAHIEPVAAAVDPLGAVLIWVQADAKVILPPTSVSSAAMYCMGDIQTQNLVPPPPHPEYGFTDVGTPTCDGNTGCERKFVYTESAGMLTCGGKATCNQGFTCATQCYPATCKLLCAVEGGSPHGGLPTCNCAYTDNPGSVTCGGKATCKPVCGYTGMAGISTCDGKPTCDCGYTDNVGALTCGGKATCNCGYTDSAGALTCGGKSTCNCGYTTPGMLTCDGKKTCSNCGYTDSQGMPTCDGKPTCNCAYGVEALGYTDSAGMPTCGGKSTCKPAC